MPFTAAVIIARLDFGPEELAQIEAILAE